MPPTSLPVKPNSPQQKAILATALVFVLLVLFGALGYWYGQKGKDDADDVTTNTSATNTASTNTSTAGAQKTVIAGKITKVLTNAIEVTTGTGENAQVITAKLVDGTSLRKLDLRTIPKNGVGDGSPIPFSELKIGNQVIIATADNTANPVTATKVSMVIYP